MKAESKKAAKSEQKKATGRAAFIHKLKAQLETKPNAFEQTKKHFSVSKSLFDRIWKRSAHNGAEKTEKAKPVKRSKTPPPRKSPPAQPAAAPAPVS